MARMGRREGRGMGHVGGKGSTIGGANTRGAITHITHPTMVLAGATFSIHATTHSRKMHRVRA